MRRSNILVVAWVVLLGAACDEKLTDCKWKETCAESGAGGGGGGVSTACIPSEAAAAVPDECGVFVSSSAGDDVTGNGSKANPFATVGQALSKLGGAKAVYLCGESYTEAVVLTAGISLYGGLKCQNGWTYGADARARLKPAAGSVGLTITGNGTSAVEDVDVSATAATELGRSSVALAVEDVLLRAARCDFMAGDGADGVAGSLAPIAAQKAATGDDGGSACSGGSQILGGEATVNGSCVTSIGGAGGVGVTNGNGGNGDAGQPSAASNGGSGEGQPRSPNGCVAGFAGDNGATGTSGAAGGGLGTIAVGGYSGAVGLAGGAGPPAQGGGGGGGAKGGMICMGGAQSGAGASGGSGGPGGCGGIGGEAGAAGGASIAVISINADVRMTDCNLITSSGGKGGAGALGQAGQSGGDGGNGGAPSGVAGSNPGCDGGKGGKGGDGGPGGGGRGGHSIGVAYVGAVPSMSGGGINTGDFGQGGTSIGDPGGAGVKADMQSFE